MELVASSVLVAVGGGAGEQPAGARGSPPMQLPVRPVPAWKPARAEPGEVGCGAGESRPSLSAAPGLWARL